ncbi:MAG: beta-ketoacyl-[acyl-carrier-protein] synthase family protein [Planctomycetota bacterium]|nr:beta-ketoacyl-[acyl-carrier-protein] synthase family protein [Planctomycetota bacterium]
MSRVYVTGMGVVSPLGNSVEQFWSGITEGRSGIRRLQRIDISDLPVSIGGEVEGLDDAPFELPEQVAWRRMDRATRFAVAAAKQAIDDAGIVPAEFGHRCAVVVGAGLSGLDTLQEQTDILLNRGPNRVSPLTIPLLMPNAAPANVSLAFGIRGPAWTVSAACASSGMAIIEAMELLRRDGADVVITGGTESSLTRLGIAAFCRMGAMASKYNDDPQRAIRPFDANRSGLVMSEGAGILILESEASVMRRGATPYAEVLGHGSTSDACHLVKPEPSGQGAAEAIRQSLKYARLEASAIAPLTYINAHGTGTKANDRAETLALKAAFGNAVQQLRVSSTKSMTGHMIGAAGAVECVACVRTLETGIIPPTINLETRDPACDLNLIAGTAEQGDIHYAINNTFGFGGHNVSLILGRVEQA